MLSVQIGNGARACGICCVSIGDGSLTRGAYQVEVRSTLSFPSELTVEHLDTLSEQLKDICLTYQALEEQKQAPEGFAVRAKAAIDIALDSTARHRAKLVQDAKGKEEAMSTESQ